MDNLAPEARSERILGTFRGWIGGVALDANVDRSTRNASTATAFIADAASPTR